MSKITEMPARFEQTVLEVKPDSPGWMVTFNCGHSLWFAIEPHIEDTYHCSACFDYWYHEKRENRNHE